MLDKHSRCFRHIKSQPLIQPHDDRGIIPWYYYIRIVLDSGLATKEEEGEWGDEGGVMEVDLARLDLLVVDGKGITALD